MHRVAVTIYQNDVYLIKYKNIEILRNIKHVLFGMDEDERRS